MTSYAASAEQTKAISKALNTMNKFELKNTGYVIEASTLKDKDGDIVAHLHRVRTANGRYNWFAVIADERFET